MTLERFREWCDRNYPADRYFSAEDRLSDIEARVNSDGNELHPNVRQELLSQFMEDYDPAFREMQERLEEQRQINEVLTGSPEPPKSIPDEIVESFRKAEFLGIDMTQFRTDREDVVPPPITKFQPRQSGFGAIASSVKGFFRRLFGR